MQSYDSFKFKSYGFDETNNTISLVYGLDEEIEFTEALQIESNAEKVGDIDAALFALHIAGGVSYYKTCLPKEIVVKSGTLNADQVAFWNTVYEKGLGEFFYRNKIDFRGLINFPSSDRSHAPTAGGKNNKVLVPIGGGKDSIVTIERLRKEGKDITLLRMGQHPIIDRLVKMSELPCINVARSLDPQLFELNKQGALNGHIPITAYLSCLCTVIAKLYGFDEIALSNEKSANIGNVEYLGMEINHQWSKSEEFEQMFQNYIASNIDTNLHYSSPIRELTELQVVEEFCKYPEYFPAFTSCNKNWKIVADSGLSGNMWCGTCPKCTFVFALMAAFVSKETMMETFKANIFNDESTLPLYKQLLGIEGFKPFECVGTAEETREAFTKIAERGEFDDTAVMNMYICNLSS